MNLVGIDRAQSVYDQIEVAYKKGPRHATVILPVIEVNPLRIALASNKQRLEAQEFEVSVSRHPTGLYAVGIESTLGLAMNTPVFFSKGLPDMSSTDTKNFERLHILVDRYRVTGSTVDFNGEVSDLNGLSADGQSLLVAQIAGLVMRRSMQHTANG